MATTLTNPYTRQSMDESVRIFRTPNNLLTSLFFPRIRVDRKSTRLNSVT